MSEYLKDWRAEAATKSWGVYDNTGKRLLSVSTGFQNQEGIAKLAAAAPLLAAALEEVCIAASRQLEGHGKGIQPSIRLEAAFAAAKHLLAKVAK